MFCQKCHGIQEVIKVHEFKDSSKPRLCDVQCLDCGEISFYQAYDFGNLINPIPNKEELKE